MQGDTVTDGYFLFEDRRLGSIPHVDNGIVLNVRSVTQSNEVMSPRTVIAPDRALPRAERRQSLVRLRPHMHSGEFVGEHHEKV